MATPQIDQAIDLEQFEELVGDALEHLPEEFGEMLDNVVVVVEETPSAEDLASVEMGPDEGDELLGLYQGLPLDQRGTEYSTLPDRVVLYRRSIVNVCNTLDEVRGEIRDTLIHELGHHFGLGDGDMPY